MRNTIANILLKVKAVTLSPNKLFTFASGIKSPIYCDNRVLISYPVEREIIIHSFVQLIKEKRLRFDVVAGAATAGIPWAAWIASRLRKPMVYVRSEAKKHGKKNQVEGILKEGSRVLVVEDLISSGNSSINTANTIRAMKANVEAVVGIFSYNMKKSKMLFEKNKIKLYVLCVLDGLLKMALKNSYINKDELNMVLEWRNKL